METKLPPKQQDRVRFLGAVRSDTEGDGLMCRERQVQAPPTTTGGTCTPSFIESDSGGNLPEDRDERGSARCVR
jgi:hypothetical protein